MATDEESRVLDALNEAFSSQILSGRLIAAQAIESALRDRETDAEWIKQHFSRLVEEIQIDAYKRYLSLERLAWKHAFSLVFGPMLDECTTPEAFADVIGEHFYALDKFFLSRTQSRRARAGGALEALLHAFFDKLGYPFEPQPRIDGNPDFVFPSEQHYVENAPDSIIFTAKRTLRERWRQIVTEGSRGLGFFLATIDEKVSDSDLIAMKEHRIFLVVPRRLKAEIPNYSAPNVISFEDFFIDYLDPAINKWKRNGVI